MTVPVTVMTVVGLSESALVFQKKPPTMRPVIAGFLLGIGLYAVNAMNPTLGKMFGMLLIVSSVLIHGIPIFTAIQGNSK